MQQFTRAGLVFPVRDSGSVQDPAVVLLHGFPQDGSAFDAVVPQLQAAGLRTLVPTQRGYAPTARPRRRSDYQMTELAADVVALLDAAGVDRAHLVGHDWGGLQAWALGSWYADRIASLTVLSTPHPAAMLRSFLTSTQALRSWYMGFFQVPRLPEAVLARTLAKALGASGLPRAFVERYTTTMAEPGALAGALNWYRAIPRSAWHPIGRVAVPTTYVWGQRDAALGRAAAECTADYVTGPYTFRRVSAGHWLPEAHPERVAEAVLERVTG